MPIVVLVVIVIVFILIALIDVVVVVVVVVIVVVIVVVVVTISNGCCCFVEFGLFPHFTDPNASHKRYGDNESSTHDEMNVFPDAPTVEEIHKERTVSPQTIEEDLTFFLKNVLVLDVYKEENLDQFFHF